ncbi:biotin-dependent carboxyltransferase family protein [Moraxella bovis]|uniref:Allophanate hydrolase subunit 2 n=1 Tax=Moraxella bovis TaxID=476 RepID=A0A378PZ48_MORBO|nr:biotin-dependent carboxyltransferase family protein [Moraxella bovis]STY93749.1 Allophanate hydrolase subunit 2 [Moraxella bovis]
MLTINTLSALASIQDLGRTGYLGLGIGRCGAMDGLSLQLGNALLGNDTHLPALEITLGGLTATFTKDTTFCLTGAIFDGTLDDRRVIAGYRYFAKQGQVLTLKRMTDGMHGYLCVQGGFDVAHELGSASTDIKICLGGLGRYVMAGDGLPYHTGREMKSMGVANLYQFGKLTNIHVIKSSEYDKIVQGRDEFGEQIYTLSPNSNRMGYRLDGTPLTFDKIEMNSHGVDFGMIQVPPDGKPIVLMADAQTTGGYPKIGAVIGADLGRLAQVRFGNQIRFIYVDADTALQKMATYHTHLHQVASMAKRFR